MSCNPSTFTLSATFSPFRAAAQAARGAQYSPDWSLVNELSFLFLQPFPEPFSKPFPYPLPLPYGAAGAWRCKPLWQRGYKPEGSLGRAFLAG